MKYYEHDGYLRTNSRNGRRYQHRDVWEAEHGELPEGMILHHIDGNKKNNAIENLELMSRAEHLLEHRTPASEAVRLEETRKAYKNMPMVELYCRVCGMEFKAKKAREKKAYYCSRECTNIYHHARARALKNLERYQNE